MLPWEGSRNTLQESAWQADRGCCVLSPDQAAEVDARMLGALLAGVRRAFPYVDADEAEAVAGAHADALFRILYAAPFGVATQALARCCSSCCARALPSLSASTGAPAWQSCTRWAPTCRTLAHAGLPHAEPVHAPLQRACANNATQGLLMGESCENVLLCLHCQRSAALYTLMTWRHRLKSFQQDRPGCVRMHKSRALYAIMLSPDAGASKQAPMFLSLVFKAVRADPAAKRRRRVSQAPAAGRAAPGARLCVRLPHARLAAAAGARHPPLAVANALVQGYGGAPLKNQMQRFSTAIVRMIK